MRSEDKLDVVVKEMEQFGGKKWVLVKHKKNGFGFIPSFEDLYRIIKAICFCEDDKYPSGEGRKMVERFLIDCCDPDYNFELLQLKYKIPFVADRKNQNDH